jgi:hypothetical protein
VEARHLNYSSPENFLHTLSSGLFFPHNPTIGHAWVVLSGKKDGKPFLFEGGHTGEFGLLAPKYLDELIRLSVLHDPDPARYLFEVLPDGKLEIGSGDHVPTLAAAFPITEQGFLRIYSILGPEGYDFSRWGLQGPQCVRFALTCMAAIGVEMECREILNLPRSFTYQNRTLPLWTHPAYASLTVETPDLLEKKLWKLVREKKAFLAMSWYRDYKKASSTL